MKSDNGTNFVGAATELNERLSILDQTKAENFLTMKGIEWRFKPPICPWMGGSCESLIKSIKRSLESITNGRTITEELLTTLLCEVESILNSRPLTSISDNIADFKALTPNHILIGSSQANTEPSNYENVEVNYRKKRRAAQVYTNLFWKKWLSEYLPTLSPRTKWANKQLIFAVGDSVIV